jgi:hypothetical protein
MILNPNLKVEENEMKDFEPTPWRSRSEQANHRKKLAQRKKSG